MERRTRPSGMLELGAISTDVAWTVACGTEPFHHMTTRSEHRPFKRPRQGSEAESFSLAGMDGLRSAEHGTRAGVRTNRAARLVIDAEASFKGLVLACRVIFWPLTRPVRLLRANLCPNR